MNILDTVTRFIEAIRCFIGKPSNSNETIKTLLSNDTAFTFNVIHSTKVIDKRINSTIQPSKISSSPFNDNMNFKFFEGKGLYKETNRIRKIRVEHFSKEEAIQELVESGYVEETISIEQAPFPAPTEAQLELLKELSCSIPEKASKRDVSNIINRIMEDDPAAETILVDFATKQKVFLSHYIGQKALLSRLWSFRDITKRVAFFILLVQKDISGKWETDLFETKYIPLAEQLLEYPKFQNSIKRLFTYDHLDFENNYPSRNTNCYKMVKEALTNPETWQTNIYEIIS